MTLTSAEQAMVEAVKSEVAVAVAGVKGHPQGFNWGFLWGVVPVARKTRTFEVKVCFGGFCPASWDAAMKAAGTVPGARATHYNMD